MSLDTQLLKLVLFAVVTDFISPSHCMEEAGIGICGMLYAETYFAGDYYTLNDGDRNVARGNTTESFRVESNCEARVCNETFFGEVCQVSNAGVYPVAKFDSISCSCFKNCSCANVFMTKSSCARAYLEGGCQRCNSLYTELKWSEDYIIEDFGSRTTAFRLRKGCTLTLYSEEELEGDELQIDSELVEDFKANYSSSRCECNDVLYEPRDPLPRPPSYPPPLEIPSGFREILNLLRISSHAHHPGLEAALQSGGIGRSSRNAYLLFLGSAGAGKSSSIDMLLKRNVTRMGFASSSITSAIFEFRIPVAIDELGVANSELRVIDTPGFGDTRGLEQDARFMATVDEYLSSHEELKSKIPNAILIFHRFHDNRFQLNNSNFVQMLRAVDSFRERITDDNFPNVVFVLSQFCFEAKTIRQRPAKKIAEFRKVIEENTSFPKPIRIIVAENKAREHDLPMVNGFFKLPNNEYYPKNLIDNLELLLTEAGDKIGLGVLRSVLHEKGDFKSSVINVPLVSPTHKNIGKYLRILTNDVGTPNVTPAPSNSLVEPFSISSLRNMTQEFILKQNEWNAQMEVFMTEVRTRLDALNESLRHHTAQEFGCAIRNH